MPSPLHPAIVHFPIVLILLGTVVALAAAFTSRWHIRWLAAALLALGALGTLAAMRTGEEEGEAVEQSLSSETLLEAHEEWAERTQGAAFTGALILIGAAAATTRRPAIAQALSIAGAVATFAASWCVYETGHRGGQLVYRHGAGVNLAPASATSGTKAAPVGVDRPRGEHGEEDDEHR